MKLLFCGGLAMTQEELDNLMDGSNELCDLDSKDDYVRGNVDDGYRVEADAHWPPPPPNEEHKVVHQLDDVTRDSEVKAIELMDRLELMDKYFSQSEFFLQEIESCNKKNIEIFNILKEKFPAVQTFKDRAEANEAMSEKFSEIFTRLQNGQNEIMVSMDAMQYQDIHRQKIERVINVMRALNKYLTSLFESKKDDSKRVSSAVYINGDDNDDVVTNDDIEALIANLGKK